MMMHETYIGYKHPQLVGRTALLLPGDNAKVWWAQFDDLTLPISWTHGWQCFKASDFRLDEEQAERGFGQ